MKDPHDIIIRPVLTEESYEGFPDKRYVFVVAPTANKTEITNALKNDTYAIWTDAPGGAEPPVPGRIDALALHGLDKDDIFVTLPVFFHHLSLPLGGPAHHHDNLEAVRDGEGRIVDLRYVDANGRACQYLGRARAEPREAGQAQPGQRRRRHARASLRVWRQRRRAACSASRRASA